jgi:hypothetical protein
MTVLTYQGNLIAAIRQEQEILHFGTHRIPWRSIIFTHLVDNVGQSNKDKSINDSDPSRIKLWNTPIYEES